MDTRWDKPTLLALKGWERPTVRAACDGKRRPARISPHGNNAWVEVCDGGHWHGMGVSWSLVCDVLNDPHQPPIDITPERPPVTPAAE
jgi:hypothetical protein